MGVFKLGKMTFGSLFRKPETVLYPAQAKPQPAGLKGHVELDAGACILCGMCERSCATDCIGVDKALRTWSIDRFQCIQCGYCITVCPKKCLSMNPNYAPAAFERTSDVVEVPVQEKTTKAASAGEKPKPAEPVEQKSAGPEPAKDGDKGIHSAQPQVKDGKSAAAEAAGDKATLEVKATDGQVESLLALMDPEKAKIVQSVLSGK